MTHDNENDTHLPNPPKKLASRIGDLSEDLESGETIVGNGEIELTSKCPVSVVEYFLGTHVDEWAESTYKDYSYDLTRWLEYCEYADIDDLSTLSSRHLKGFKSWRKRDENVGLVSLHGQLANVRVFIRGCERLELVDQGLAGDIVMPDLDPSDIVSHTRVDPEMADQILEYNRQFDYVTREFAEFTLVWTLLLRLGGARSLDLNDYNREEQYIEVTHSPEEDTPLKNGESKVEGEGGERLINVPDWVCEILNTYIDGTGDPNHPKRIDVEDEFGREPLFTTRYGRVSETTFRRDLYRITQPCRHGQSCPHDMDPDTCEARNDNDILSKCLSNVSPHPVRRGGICHQIKQGVPRDTICERADVSRKVLKKHYDLRTKEEARQQRRKELRKHLDGFDDPTKTSSEGQSFVQDKVPSLTETTALKDGFSNPLERTPDRARLVNGIALYAVFVTLTGLNLGLLGIGFDPTAWEVIVNI